MGATTRGKCMYCHFEPQSHNLSCFLLPKYARLRCKEPAQARSAKHTNAVCLRLKFFCPSQVDLVFSGHVHSYARTCNVLAGECVDMQQGG